ncbi:hypothetical protein Ddc_19307 [Ditylenchus destructor]|nr:hypothetical protein Ddc_19307 [Ditylenchus destructor]
MKVINTPCANENTLQTIRQKVEFANIFGMFEFVPKLVRNPIAIGIIQLCVAASARSFTSIQKRIVTQSNMELDMKNTSTYTPVGPCSIN